MIHTSIRVSLDSDSNINDESDMPYAKKRSRRNSTEGGRQIDLLTMMGNFGRLSLQFQTLWTPIQMQNLQQNSIDESMKSRIDPSDDPETVE
jgi:hypothetical protein